MPASNAQIHLHNRLAEFIQNWNVVQTYTSLGMFGSLSPKPTKLFSDDGWVAHLHRNSGACGLLQQECLPLKTNVDFYYIHYLFFVVQVYCITALKDICI